MKTVIMAGGKGTRISSIALDIPKPMIKIDGIPILEREIDCLVQQGFDEAHTRTMVFTVLIVANIFLTLVNQRQYQDAALKSAQKHDQYDRRYLGLS